MKLILPTLLALNTAVPVLAQSDISGQIGTEGLRATEAALAALADPSATDRFALGGVRFLTAIETALQTRYRTGMSTSLTTIADIPILRLPIPENPAPEPFSGAIIEDMFAQVSRDMAGSIAALALIGEEADVGLTIDTADIWFDIDASGSREVGEGLIEVTGLALNGGIDPASMPVIRFDTADAAWLSAYAHLLAGVSDIVLSLAPGDAIDKVLNAMTALDAINPPPLVPDPYAYDFDSQFGDYVDYAAMVLGAIEGQPDVARSRTAHAHLLAMIADNRRFWAGVARETDNDAEWIPNKRQVSALPIAFPADTGAVWQLVLAEAEAALQGDLLIPHWRMGESAGIDLAMLMQDPPPIDIIGMIQGGDLLPYARPGRLISGDSLVRFDALMQGDAGLFMVILN